MLHRTARILVGEQAVGILLERAQAEPVDQRGDARLSGPEPCGAGIELRPANRLTRDPPAKAVPRLDEVKRLPPRMQHIGEAQPGQPAPDDQNIGFHPASDRGRRDMTQMAGLHPDPCALRPRNRR